MLGFNIGMWGMFIVMLIGISITDMHEPKDCHQYNHTLEEVYENQLEKWKKDKPIKENE